MGGHCIGVDPYYLTHKAEQVGYYPEVVLAGRRINDAMGSWAANSWCWRWPGGAWSCPGRGWRCWA